MIVGSVRFRIRPHAGLRMPAGKMRMIACGTELHFGGNIKHRRRNVPAAESTVTEIAPLDTVKG